MTEITIYIDWIRHGFSCANAIKQKGHVGVKNILKNLVSEKKIGDSRSIYAPNSRLTDFGIEQAETVNKIYNNRIKNYDLICSSELTRAVETAMILAKNTKIEKIYMIPYVSEQRSKISLKFSLDADNQARDPEIIKKEVETKFQDNNNDKYPKIDLSIMEKFIKYDPKNKTTPDLKLFITKVLPEIKELLVKSNNKQVFHIAIISHRKFIEKIFKTYVPLLHPNVNNLYINTMYVKINYKNDITQISIPETCGLNYLEENNVNTKKHTCRIMDDMLYEKLKDLNKIENKKIERCLPPPGNKDREKAKKVFIGGYYNKYLKYKLKYLNLKK